MILRERAKLYVLERHLPTKSLLLDFFFQMIFLHHVNLPLNPNSGNSRKKHFCCSQKLKLTGPEYLEVQDT